MPSKKKRPAATDVARASIPKSKPKFLVPMAAESVTALPEGEEWLYEAKLDGYRALLIKDGTRLDVRSRNDKDLTRMYPSVASAARRLNAEQAIVDGEIVALDKEGRPSFQALQHRGSHPDHQIVFYAFDLLHLNGHELLELELTSRQELLPQVVGESGLLLLRELPGTLTQILAAVQQYGLEGIVAKRKSSLYVPGERTKDWLKLKMEHQQEFVVGGYRPAGQSVDALLVGYYEGKELRFAAKVRAGFVPTVRREVFAKLQPLHAEICPFANLPCEGSSRWGGGVSAEDMKAIQWVKPELVAQIRFVEWTAEGRLRHAAFLGLRQDKSARDVARE